MGFSILNIHFLKLRDAMLFMAKLYFLGGENVNRRDAREVNEAAFADACTEPSILVFPWARPSFDTRYQRRRTVTNYFRSLGAASVEFCDYLETQEEIRDKIARSNVIYLTGGQVTTLVTRLKTTSVDSLLRDYSGVIVGRSAGALVLGKLCFVRNRYSGAVRVVFGLGLVDFSVKVHYDSSKDKWLKELSKTEKIYGLPQRSALVYDRGAISFLGDVVLFEKGEKKPQK